MIFFLNVYIKKSKKKKLSDLHGAQFTRILLSVSNLFAREI